MSESLSLVKLCAGNGCGREGIHQLTIIFLNKVGWFCDSCKNELVTAGLVVENKTSGISIASKRKTS